MKKFRKILNSHFRNKMFNKIFVFYTLIALVSILCLSFYILLNIYNNIKQNYIEDNTKVMNLVNNFFIQKSNNSQNFLQQLYMDSDLISDLINFLNLETEAYLNNRLNLYYYNTNLFMQKYNYYIKKIYSQDKDVENVVLYSFKNNYLYTTNQDGTIKEIIRMNMMPKVNRSINNNLLVDLGDNLSLNQFKNSICFVSTIKDPNSLKDTGYQMIFYNTKSIDNLILNSAPSNNGLLMVVSDKGDILYKTNNMAINNYTRNIKILNDEVEVLNLDKKAYVNSINLSSLGIKIFGIIPFENIYSSFKIMQRTIILLSALIVVLSIILSYFVIYTFSKRISIIMTGLNKLKEGDLTVRLPDDFHEDELSQIVNHFNTMCDSLNSYINKVYISEIRQKNAEITALQTQINPHFLYNTLEVIRMKAVSQGSKEIGEMIYILSTIFRYVTKGEKIVSIIDEIEISKLYLNLIKYRFKEQISFNIDISNEILFYSIIKFLFQPIIENYFVHGFDANKNNNTINIKGYKEKEDIIFTFEDNGIGIEDNKLSQLTDLLNSIDNNDEKKSGLINVNERIKLIYGNQYGIKIESTLYKGTKVVMKIPAIKKEDLDVQSIVS